MNMAKINLDYFNAQDDLSNNIFDEEILQIVKNNTDFTDILHHDKRMHVKYSLSPIRRNLLEWYDFNNMASLLEIGGEYGALSGMFAEKVRDVKVIELCRGKAEVIYNRHKCCANLEILVGNFTDVQFTEKFDYIVVNIFKYVGQYMNEKQPHKLFLADMKQRLKPNGKLIIIIENKFGLKYWAGAPEEDTGRRFESIENYPTGKNIQTFGKYELEGLIKSVGFHETLFYYPMPDHNLPNVIYSDSFLPDETAVFDVFSMDSALDSHKMFNENLTLNSIIKNDMFTFFANSFIVIAS